MPPSSDAARASLAPETLRGYEAAWERFCRWARLRGVESLPAAPLTLVNFLGEHYLRLSTSSLRTFLDAVAREHVEGGYDSPIHARQVEGMWMQVRLLREERDRDRATGALPEERALPEAFLTPRIRAMLAGIPDGLLGCRDRLALITGAAGSLTRNELVALEVGDIEDTGDEVGGGVIRVHPPASAQQADPNWVVRSVRVAPASDPSFDLGSVYEAWLDASGIGSGPLLRSVDRHGHVSETGLSVRALNVIVTRCAERVGLESRGYMDEIRRA